MKSTSSAYPNNNSSKVHVNCILRKTRLLPPKVHTMASNSSQGTGRLLDDLGDYVYETQTLASAIDLAADTWSQASAALAKKIGYLESSIKLLLPFAANDAYFKTLIFETIDTCQNVTKNMKSIVAYDAEADKFTTLVDEVNDDYNDTKSAEWWDSKKDELQASERNFGIIHLKLVCDDMKLARIISEFKGKVEVRTSSSFQADLPLCLTRHTGLAASHL